MIDRQHPNLDQEYERGIAVKLIHSLSDRMSVDKLLWLLRHLPHWSESTRREIHERYPPIPHGFHAPTLVDAVVRAGGYSSIERNLTWLNRHRFAFRAAAVLTGAHFFKQCAVFDGSPPPRGSIVVVPHLGIPFMHQAHLLTLGHRVLLPVYDPHRRFLKQWDNAKRISRFPAQAALQIANLPDPLFAFRAKRALDGGVTLTWQPDTFFRGRGPAKVVEVSLLGARLPVAPLIEKLASEANIPVFVAYNRLQRDGARLLMTYIRVPSACAVDGELTRRLYAIVDDVILSHVSQWTQWRSYASFSKDE
jgi:hypothetical protein